MNVSTDSNRVEEALARADLRRKLPPPAMRRALRVSRGLTGADVAAHCGVTRQLVSKWERGERNPSGQRLELYADLLDRLAKEGL